MTTEFVHQRQIRAIRLPDVGEVLSLWMHRHLKTAEIAEILRLAEIRRFVTRSDGEPIDRHGAQAILDDADSFAAYRDARDAELAAATEGGLVLAECPHCHAWQADLIPLALAVGLRTSFWPLVDRVGDLAVPAAAVAAARELGSAPPSSLLSILPPRDAERPLAVDPGGGSVRLRQWWTWSDQFFDQADTADWTADSLGWSALLRLASAVPDLVGGGPKGPESVRALTRVPLADVLFVDNVYFLTHLAPLPADHGLLVRCARCGGEFLPLARSPEWASSSGAYSSIGRLS